MAKYTIPSVLPSIKFSAPSVRKDAYTNPQYIRDRSFEVFNKGMQDAIKGGLLSREKKLKAIKEEKAAQELLNKEAMEYELNQLNQVQGLVNTGNTTFDTNKMDFFYALKEKYIDIKNDIDKHPERRSAGLRAMSELEGLMTQYKTAAPSLIKTIGLLDQQLKIPQGEKGSIWSQSPTDLQVMLKSITGHGGADVGLVDNKGKLFLYMPPQTYTYNGNEITTKGAQMDIGSFLNMESRGGELFETMPDYTKETLDIINDAITVDGQVMGTYRENEEVIIPGTNAAGGKEAVNMYTWKSSMPNRQDPSVKDVMSPYLNIPGLVMKDNQPIPNPFYSSVDPSKNDVNGRTAAMIATIQMGGYNALLNPPIQSGGAPDNDMAVIWTDAMNKDSEWDAADPLKVSEALGWLAENGISQLENKQGYIGQSKPYTYKPGGDDDGDGGGTERERSNRKIYNNVSSAFGKAFNAYGRGDYDKLKDLLEPITGIKDMTVVEDPDGKEYDFILKSKTTSTGKQGDILNFNVRQPGELDKILQFLGLVGTPTAKGGGDFVSYGGEKIDWSPSLKNFRKSLENYDGANAEDEVENFLTSHKFDVETLTEDGKASGKSQKMTIAEMYGIDPKTADFQRGMGNAIELPNGVEIKIDKDGSWKQELLNVLEESFTKVGFTQANKPTKKTDWNNYKTN